MFNICNIDGFVIGGFMINVYDFDGTIYDGDSTIDFIKYCFKKNKRSLLILPNFFVSYFLYLLRIYNKEKLKSSLFKVILYFNDIEQLVDNFWKSHLIRIKPFYLKQKKSSDIIISASPIFLLKPIEKIQGVTIIATEVDLKSGKIIGKNCHGEEKVKSLKKAGVKSINNFYSDSLSDLPLAKKAKKAFLVKKDTIKEWFFEK